MDIVEMLRQGTDDGLLTVVGEQCVAAADEIERLRGIIRTCAAELEKDGDELGVGFALRMAIGEVPNAQLTGAAPPARSEDGYSSVAVEAHVRKTITRKNKELSMDRKQFRAVLDWRMCSDPWPGGDEETVDQWINEMAHAFGFEHWIQAYHELDAERLNSAAGGFSPAPLE